MTDPPPLLTSLILQDSPPPEAKSDSGGPSILLLTQQRDLDRLQAVIERGLRTFIEVGEALANIRDGGLYRREYPTFEDYTSSRWGFGRRRADQLINAGAVGTIVLTAIPDALTRHGLNEGHARELNALSRPRRSRSTRLPQPSLPARSRRR